jgi:hypothetical protein
MLFVDASIMTKSCLDKNLDKLPMNNDLYVHEILMG